MSENLGDALDSTAIQPGDFVNVHSDGHSPYGGYVEEVSPPLNIIWVRELRTWERKMISTCECHIYRTEPVPGGGPGRVAIF